MNMDPVYELAKTTAEAADQAWELADAHPSDDRAVDRALAATDAFQRANWQAYTLLRRGG